MAGVFGMAGIYGMRFVPALATMIVSLIFDAKDAVEYVMGGVMGRSVSELGNSLS